MNPAYHYRYIVWSTGVASLAGLIFGCDTAIVSGAIGFLKTHFQLSAKLTGWAVSSLLLACIFGSIIAGTIGDRYGRKWSLFGCAILSIFSALLAACAPSFGIFTTARLMGGISIGAASMLAPLYIAELAPSKIRGMLVSLYQLAIVGGMCVVWFIYLQVQRLGGEAWNITNGWRWMFALLTIPAGLLAGLSLIISESPRWLIKVGRREEAKRVLEKLGNRDHAQFEMQQVEEVLAQEEGHWSELFTSGYFRPLVIAVLLAIFVQFTGINAVMYYAPEIFKTAGETVDAAFLQTAIIGGMNFLFTCVAIVCVDRMGRKPLLLIGTFVQTIALFSMGFLLHQNMRGPMLLISILAFVAAFALALGPLFWILNSEIFPTKIRGRAMSFAILVLWVSNTVVTQTFPILAQSIGAGNTFWIYSFMSLLAFFFVLKMLPETKGLSLEEIERSWNVKQ